MSEAEKELVREWRRKLRSAFMDDPTIDWRKVHDVLESMTAYIGEGPVE